MSFVCFNLACLNMIFFDVAEAQKNHQDHTVVDM